jgi:hypothetical protein
VSTISSTLRQAMLPEACTCSTPSRMFLAPKAHAA